MGLGDELSKFIPKDFGKKKQKKTSKHQTGTPTERAQAADKAASKETASDTPAEATATTTNDGTSELPTARYFRMTDHQKSVSSLSWDRTGDTLLTGDHKSLVKLWDFSTMDQHAEPFRTLAPFESQRIRQLQFNKDGSQFLCISSDPRAKLYDSSGHSVCEFKRGDMYVTDMRKTSGHVAALNAVDWCPTDSSRFLTASGDSTVRIWDCEQPHKQLQVIVAKTRVRGARVAVTAAGYANEGSVVVAAQQDGGVSLWSAKGPYTRPTAHIEKAHVQGCETSFVGVAADGHTLATRSTDDTVKLWDLRNLKSPTAEIALESPGAEANLAFSPDAQHILAGMPNGQISVLNSQTLAPLRTISVPKTTGAITCVSWHSSLNQIAVGSTDGSVTILFDPETSQKGAVLCADKKPRRKHIDDQVTTSSMKIITPHALPMFREDRPMSAKRRREKQIKETQKPRQPVHGHGHGGEIGINETQHIMKSLIKDTLRDEDPREALLRYAAVAEADPKFIAPAYKGTQDKPVFDESGMADEPAMKRRK
ncbi:hypothetical protein FBU59_000988 [Linderina macrospora]|uniref:Uncharacterized protein n=1 Tax=Linderina macrospora TaxID=4868 RepID=A0ACC1JF42_9FUNG|nr:hypothetical protein FBU59_000988 [Linderina macrospora]